MGLEFTEDESTAVEEDHERVWPSALFWGIVSRDEWPDGAVNYQIPHDAYRGRWATRYRDLATEGLACFGCRESLQRECTPTFEQREPELYLGLQGLAVQANSRAAREQNLDPWWQDGD